MKVQVDTQEKSLVKVTVELSEKKMETYRKKAAEALQSQVKIDGFRSGNIPLDVLERHVGEQAFMNQVLDFAVTETYEEAVKMEGVRPVDYPKLSITSHDPLKYEAIVPVVPDITWEKDIKKLKVTAKKIEVKKADIDEVLETLKQRGGAWKIVEKKAKKGDRVEVDFAGFDLDGVELDGTASKNHPVILGENSLIPGFEDEIIGMKKDEEKEFKITFPKDYHADQFKGKKVKFQVKLNQVEEAEEIKLDDAFAKRITGGAQKDMTGLKAEIKEELMHKKEHEMDAQLENDFLKELLGYVKADLPEAMLVREREMMLDRIKKDVEKQKITWEKYLEQVKKTDESVQKELEKPAKDQVMIRLGLEKLFDETELTVTDDEVEQEIEHMLGHYSKEMAPMMKERFVKDGEQWSQVERQLMLRKLVAIHTK